MGGVVFFFFKQKTAYKMLISDWSSDVCSSDLKAVKERTSACDFTSMDLRGMRDVDTGEWLPVTLYICVNQAEAQAFANITALLYEVLSRDFLSYGPGEQDKRGRTMGPKTIRSEEHTSAPQSAMRIS